MDKKYLNTKQAAAFLNLSFRTLQKFRVTGGGPVYYRLGGTKRGKPVYAQDELIAYVEERRERSTSTTQTRRSEAVERAQ